MNRRLAPSVVFGLLLFILVWNGAPALKCKCSQSSPKVPCEHGVCEVPSATSACLMLDHPLSGRHYACSTSELKEGECVEKQSKSGASVKVCSCNSSDFCNFKIWPDGKEEEEFVEDNEESSEDGEARLTEESGEQQPRRRTTSPNGALATHTAPVFVFVLAAACPALLALFAHFPTAVLLSTR